MNRKSNSVKKLQEECKKRNIGFMSSWTKAALIKRLEDEDKREITLDELKKEVEEKDKKIKALDPKTVEKETISALVNNKRNELSVANKQWNILTEEQDIHYAEVDRIGELKKALRNEMNNLELFLKSFE